jgi:hypothetical protein
LLAEKIVEVLEESGASETERHVALEIAKALVPILPNASCSIEAKIRRICDTRKGPVEIDASS